MAQKKKKPKVVLKKTQVIILAVAIVAVCACMLAVVSLTAPESRMYFPITAEKKEATGFSPENPSLEDSSQETAQQTMDAGVAQVIAQLEAAEKQAKETLSIHRYEVEQLAKILFHKESLNKTEINNFFSEI